MRSSIARTFSAVILWLPLLWSPLFAQPTVVVGHDISSLPVVRVRIIPSPKIPDPSSRSSWTVMDNGEAADVIGCRRLPAPVRPVSDVVLCIDVSNSIVEQGRMSSVRAAAERLLDRLVAAGASVAIVHIDNDAHIGSDFSGDRTQLREGLSRMFAGRSSSIVSALTEPLTGALSMLPKKSVRPSVIVITDSEDPFNDRDVIPLLRSQGASISFLGLGGLTMAPHIRCADSTGGVVVRCAADSLGVTDGASALASALIDGTMVELVWRMPSRRTTGHAVDIRSVAEAAPVSFSYIIPDEMRTRLESPEHLTFGVVPPSRPAASFLSLTAVNGPFRVDSIRFETPPKGFGFTQEFPLAIDSGATVNIPLRFAPDDTSFVWTRLAVYPQKETPISISLSGGRAVRPVVPPTLRFRSPRGGEEFFVDSYVPLAWEGSEPGDLHRIDVSTDGGKTWTTSTDSVRGSGFLWHTPLDSAGLVLLRVSHLAPGSQGNGIIQQCTLASPLRIRDSRSFFRAMEMNPTVVGTRKDKIFDNVFTNSSTVPVTVEAVDPSLMGQYIINLA
ncbi:MAG: vWA domain-containing protein, partial [Candidatus Kapaibacterium sp.]